MWAHLVAGVEKSENVALLHGGLAGRLLCVVIQSHHLLRTQVIYHRSLLLLHAQRHRHVYTRESCALQYALKINVRYSY